VEEDSVVKIQDKKKKKKKKIQKKRAVGMAVRSFPMEEINFFAKGSDGADRELQRKNDVKGVRLQLGSALFGVFVRTETCEALIGDLEEGFVSKSGESVHQALLWYWGQVFSSLAPIIWAAFVSRFKGASIRT
jgi:hypothetical protein